jgi:ADP-dependent phosphofructokinase/glucokinase
MTDTDTLAKQLAEAAEKATPGPWVSSGSCIACDQELPNSVTFLAPIVRGRTAIEAEANTQFIAIANPENIKVLLTEREALREALKDCADSLEAHVEHEYKSIKDYPSMKRKYEQDMEDVYRARALLKGESKYD